MKIGCGSVMAYFENTTWSSGKRTGLFRQSLQNGLANIIRHKVWNGSGETGNDNQTSLSTFIHLSLYSTFGKYRMRLGNVNQTSLLPLRSPFTIFAPCRTNIRVRLGIIKASFASALGFRVYLRSFACKQRGKTHIEETRQRFFATASF